jgi:hypothetical protein
MAGLEGVRAVTTATVNPTLINVLESGAANLKYASVIKIVRPAVGASKGNRGASFSGFKQPEHRVEWSGTAGYANRGEGFSLIADKRPLLTEVSDHINEYPVACGRFGG